MHTNNLGSPRRTNVPAARPDQPLFIIGDVHGMANQLVAALDCARGLGLPDLRIVFLGDLIDRGPDSLRCLQLAAEARTIAPCTYLFGNHEQFMFVTLYDPSQSDEARFNWRRNGGKWAEDVALSAQLRVWDLLPVNWQISFTSGTCLCVHAGVPTQAAPDELQAFLHIAWTELPRGAGCSFYHPLWLRREFDANPAPGRFVVHGHTPQDFTGTPHPGRLNLDAGTSKTGVVSSALIRPNGDVVVYTWT